MMEITRVDNGYVVKTETQTRVAKSLEEVMDLALMHYEGRSSEFSGNSYGAVIILRCKCFQLNDGGLSRTDRIAGCSVCSERLALLV